MKYTPLVFMLIVAMSSCKSTKDTSSLSSSEMEKLLGYMQGSFDSATQAANDSSYYDISLHMYPIWEDRDGNYLYVEQALSSMQDKPYRQRVYKVEQEGPGRYVSHVYTIEAEDDVIGSWKTPTIWDQYTAADIKLKPGCEVHLAAVGNNYTGKTNDKTCTSSLRGASYATSSVTITDKKIESWDQGWNDNGEQVWGAVKTGYIFDKK